MLLQTDSAAVSRLGRNQQNETVPSPQFEDEKVQHRAQPIHMSIADMVSNTWEFIFGGRYEKTRFRLDDSGPAPNGIGQDKAFPLFALAEYAFDRDTRLSLIGGAEVGANMRLEDSNGRHISDSDLSTAPFIGAAFQMKF